MLPLRRRGADPVGDAIPFLHDDIYHLFCLSAPSSSSVWLHWRSFDLASWEQAPPAVGPTADDPQAPDAAAAWTGSVVAHAGRFHLFYTGSNPARDTPQTICRATSDDLVTFTKDPANPLVCPDTDDYAAADWRDPFVFYNDQESCYWMLIATRRAHGPRWRSGCIALATSTDLQTWTLEPEPLYQPGDTYCPECPELFCLGQSWYLVYSRFSERAGTIYRVAADPRGPWRQPADEALDGRRWYAAKSMPVAGQDARVFFGWVHEREGATDTGPWRWGGDLACPRVVRESSPGRLTVELPDAATAPFTRRQPVRLGPAHRVGGTSTACIDTDRVTGLGAPGATEYVFADVDPAVDTYLLDVTLRPGDCGEFGLLFRVDDDLAGYAVAFERRRGSVSLIRGPQPVESPWDRSFPPGTFALDVDGPRLVEMPTRFAPDRPVECRLMVAGSVVEVYVGGQVALSYRIHARGRHELGFYVQDGRCDVEAIRLRTA